MAVSVHKASIKHAQLANDASFSPRIQKKHPSAPARLCLVCLGLLAWWLLGLLAIVVLLDELLFFTLQEILLFALHHAILFEDLSPLCGCHRLWSILFALVLLDELLF